MKTKQGDVVTFSANVNIEYQISEPVLYSLFDTISIIKNNLSSVPQIAVAKKSLLNMKFDLQP